MDMCFDKMAMRKHKRSGYLTEYEKLLDKAKDNNVTIYEKYDRSAEKYKRIFNELYFKEPVHMIERITNPPFP